MDVDLYAFFGISADCTIKEIKRAYKDKARQLHPDKNKDNPKAKEEFQQLKAYYELLHDPITRKEYDKKWKAKMESAKRHQALDSERRKFKEKLEAQEERARREREHARKHNATVAVAEELRREWQSQLEQEERDLLAKRKRALEEQQMKEQEELLSSCNQDCVLRIKWNTTDNPEAAACYTKDFLVTCLSEYGDVVALTVGKRGTAVVEFHSHKEALQAVTAAEHDLIGLPALPLKLSFISTKQSNRDDMPNVAKQKREDETFSTPRTATNFDSFESDILARMANFNA